VLVGLKVSGCRETATLKLNKKLRISGITRAANLLWGIIGGVVIGTFGFAVGFTVATLSLPILRYLNIEIKTELTYLGRAKSQYEELSTVYTSEPYFLATFASSRLSLLSPVAAKNTNGSWGLGYPRRLRRLLSRFSIAQLYLFHRVFGCRR